MDNRQKTALSVAVLSSFLTPFMGSSLNVALPSMGKEFSMNAIMISWVATAYLLSAAILLLPFGKMADMYGRKKIFLSGMIIFTISSFMGALAPTGTFMLISRVIQGIGSTMIFGTGIAIISAVFPPGERGKAIGINASSVYLGLSLGPFIGGILTQHLGWRSIFWLMVPIGLLTIFLVARYLEGEWTDNGKKQFDWGGASIYALALVGIMLGFSELSGYRGIILLGSGLFLLFFFIRFEGRSENPILDVTIMKRNRIFLMSNLAALINYSATFAIVFMLSLYLQYVKGFTAQRSGLILFAQPVIMTLVSPIAGNLSDRFEPRLIASAGMAVCTIGLAIFAFLIPGTPVILIILNLMFLGIGFALFSSPNTNAIMGSVEKQHLGVASAVVGTMRLTGQMLSMGIAMLLITLFVGKEKITVANQEDFINSLQLSFTVFAILCLAGIFASLARGKINNRQ